MLLAGDTTARYHRMWCARHLALWLADLHLNPRRWETVRLSDTRPTPYNPKSPGRIMPGGIVDPNERQPSMGVNSPGDVPLFAHIMVPAEARIGFRGCTLRLTPTDYKLAQQVMANEGLLAAWEAYIGAWYRQPLFRISGQRGGGYYVRPNGPRAQCEAALIALAHTREWVQRPDKSPPLQSSEIPAIIGFSRLD